MQTDATIGHAPEEVWNQDLTMGFFTSGGGGFSNHFSTPNYQKTAVANYLKFLAKNDPATLKKFNTKGVRISYLFPHFMGTEFRS